LTVRSDFDRCYRELGFSRNPFGLTPDTDFFYPVREHLAALAHLYFGVTSGGFTVLTGEVGLGKTLLCRQLLRRSLGGVHTAYVFNPQLSYADLLQSIYHDLTGKSLEGYTVGKLHNEIYRLLIHLAARGRRVAVLVDEAHRLPPSLLEGLRLLSNLETEKEKLLSLLLVGQPELEQTLRLPSMRPLAQRISVRFHLKPFGYRDTIRYIRHRLLVASQPQTTFRFCASALLRVHRHSRGVPRQINQICDRALLAAFAAGNREVSDRMVRLAARETVENHA
jgi:general secretion pathway protein A